MKLGRPPQPFGKQSGGLHQGFGLGVQTGELRRDAERPGQRARHDPEGGRLAGPELKGECALVCEEQGSVTTPPTPSHFVPS